MRCCRCSRSIRRLLRLRTSWAFRPWWPKSAKPSSRPLAFRLRSAADRRGDHHRGRSCADRRGHSTGHGSRGWAVAALSQRWFVIAHTAGRFRPRGRRLCATIVARAEGCAMDLAAQGAGRRQQPAARLCGARGPLRLRHTHIAGAGLGSFRLTLALALPRA